MKAEEILKRRLIMSESISIINTKGYTFDKIIEAMEEYAELARKEGQEKVREAVADYKASEGCSCCQDVNAHEKHTKILAELLGVKPYEDLSGYDFSIYRNKKNNI